VGYLVIGKITWGKEQVVKTVIGSRPVGSRPESSRKKDSDQTYARKHHTACCSASDLTQATSVYSMLQPQHRPSTQSVINPAPAFTPAFTSASCVATRRENISFPQKLALCSLQDTQADSRHLSSSSRQPASQGCQLRPRARDTAPSQAITAATQSTNERLQFHLDRPERAEG
jgi:hypothetical protein